MTSSNVDHAIALPIVAAVHDVLYHSIASLALLVWNSLVTLDDEVQYIWTMRNRSQFKWVYFFLRYGVILAHVTHNIFFQTLAHTSDLTELCHTWLVYVMLLPQSIGTSLEFILASRVFALYNRSRKIAFLLLILILLEIAGTAKLLWMRSTIFFHGTCLLLQLDENAWIQSILGFVVHCTLLGLTLSKYFLALREGWGRTPLVSLMVRHGSSVYAITVFVILTVVILFNLQNERGIAIVFWSTSLISILGCRLILSMERLARNHISVDRLLFTSEFRIATNVSGR